MITHEKPEVIPAELVMRVHRVAALGLMDAHRFLQDASPLFYSRFVEAVLRGQDAGERGENFQHLYDPIEDEPEFAAIFEQARRQTAEEVAAIIEEIARTRPPELQFMRRRGQIHLYSATLQRILREEYGIEWFSIPEMNPGVIID